jgi:hypothetical protein
MSIALESLPNVNRVEAAARNSSSKTRRWRSGPPASAVTRVLREIVEALPFALRGVDCDRGSELINHHVQGFGLEPQVGGGRRAS